MTEAEAKSEMELTQDLNKRSTARKRLRILAGVVLAGVILPPLVVPYCRRPWSEINCEHQDINIKTGQARYSRYLWYVKIWETVRDTPISLALGGQVIDVADVEPWHRVNTFAMGSGYSPYYRFHGALFQGHELGKTFQTIEMDPEEKREIAENVLKLWQTGRSYRPANDYLRTVFEERMNLSDRK